MAWLMVEVELSERDCLLLLWATTHRAENLRAEGYDAATTPYHDVHGKLLEALNRTQMQDGGEVDGRITEPIRDKIVADGPIDPADIEVER